MWHVFSLVYQWSLAGTFTQHLRQPFTAWGLVALTCLDFMMLFSIALFRDKAYAFFFATHIVGAVLVLPAVCPSYSYLPPV